MDLEYDRKFEEMKKYIPFLENMIKRLESTNKGVKNPRKAQLDKIRSLRDLLLDKKKRMKMENLLKCEQVLVNLYAKVEQRDSMTDTKEDSGKEVKNEKSNLNIVRNKLKSVASKLQEEIPETLPEIARATNTEVVCTPGSKEPALFQRRPNKALPLRQSPTSHNDDNPSNNKRHYTRVLLSPERKKKEWLANSDTKTDKPLFSRRSPRRSPRRFSPSYKKERKKSSKRRSKSSQRSKDLNITLKVPEESLGSLNTKDILSRIINCSDNDVDINTLRGLRSQILGELKQTGAKDDISDLILKSYKKKEKRSKKKDEVEEGELSDSESEAIENIYGSLVVVNQGEDNSNTNKVSGDKQQPRKIQICLVINSDKESESKVNDQSLNTNLDITDFEAYTKTITSNKTTLETGDKITEDSTSKQIINKEKDIPAKDHKVPLKSGKESLISPKKDITKSGKKQISSQETSTVSSTETFKPNFYQPFTDEKSNTDESANKQNACKFNKEDSSDNKDETVSNPVVDVKNISDSSAKPQMKKEIVSEIDILQALKKEILAETAVVPMSDVVTPPLHQPKITKVASAQEIISKKRISIEKYKQKSVLPIKQPLFNSVKQQTSTKDDSLKKQSLKLTEKECERFNFPVDVSPVDSSEDEDKPNWDFEFLHESKKSPNPQNKAEFSMDFEFLHSDSVPKSPDHEDFADTGIKPPVIIPSDPVKNVVPTAKVDIDMRTILPLLSPVYIDGSKKSIKSLLSTNDKILQAPWNEQVKNTEKIKKSTPDFRMRPETNKPVAKNSPNSYLTDTEKLSRPNTNYSKGLLGVAPNIPSLMSLNIAPHMTPPQNLNVSSINPILNSNIPLILNPNMTPTMTPTGMVPNMNPNMTPSRMIPGVNPMMTPILTANARSYEMTPRPNFDIEDYTKQKHVYAPIFPTFQQHEFSEKDTQVNQWENNDVTKWEDRNRKASLKQDIDYHRNRNDRYIGDKRLDSPLIRMDCPSTPNPSFGRMDCTSTSNVSFGIMDCPPTPNPSFGRMECPSTPNSSFGRTEYPPTPNPSFGRMECPPTPNPSFGRIECPPTPNSSFGRMETPMTPVHSFGRSDCPLTPSHPFGRSDGSMTPTHVFGRSDYHHNTSSCSQNYVKFQDPRLNRSSDYDKCQSRNDERSRSYLEDDNMIENSNRYGRNQVKSFEQGIRNNRDRMPRRESSVGRTLPGDYESDESYKKDYYNNDYQYRKEKYNHNDDAYNKRNYRAKSMGRMNSSEDSFSSHRDKGVAKTNIREGSIEKPISVKSHTGRTFNIDTSFNRTFQDTVSLSLNKSFDARRQRASSVGRSLHESSRKPTTESVIKNKLELHASNCDTKAMKFRRACSVGRDLVEENANKNFKDIKEDLRSCKFNNYNFNLRDRDHNSTKSSDNSTNKKVSASYNRDMRITNTNSTKSTGHHIDRDPRRRVRDYDSKLTMIDDSFKYSPRKNYRDPRMRREVNVKDKYNDKGSSSNNARYKNYGIVYSNDNIAKGTILASAAGVKNFKIPKIKRLEENESEINSQTEADAKKEAKKEDSITSDHCKKVESKPKRLETDFVNNRRDVENVNKPVTFKADKPKFKENGTSFNKKLDTMKGQDSSTGVVNSILDSCERRITRSAIKGVTTSKQLNTSSPIKKLRRIKRPLVYDSDSDSQENESNSENVENNTEKDKSMQVSEDTESSKNNVCADKELTIEKKLNTIDVATEHIQSSSSTNENIICTDLSDEKNRFEIVKGISAPVNESYDGQNDSLDISFGVDDELFPDNIATGSVLDNINALIADLDHDIEEPKINDFNDKFINNIVGDISSNNSPIPIEANQTDFSANLSLHDKLGFVVDVENAMKYSSAETSFSKDNEDATYDTGTKNNSDDINVLTQSAQPVGIQNKNKEMKNDSEKNSQIDHQTRDSNVTTSVKENHIKSITEKPEAPENVNTDAIVSTTAYDEKSDVSKDSQCTSRSTVPSTYPSVPDSTIHSNENDIHNECKDVQESIPDSTNELASETNITSSHNAGDMSPKVSLDINSISADNLPRIDSINKLLSILEDKNKIKELLTLLNKDSGENERIKKKLEKLSEIVSDDEENTVTKEDVKPKTHTLTNQNLEKHIDPVKQLQNDNKNVKQNESCDEKSTICSTTTLPQSNDGLQYINERRLNNKEIATDDQCMNMKEHEVVDVDKNVVEKELLIDDNVENRKITNDTKKADPNITELTIIDHQVEENSKILTNENVNDSLREHHEQISEVSEKQMELADNLPSQLKPEKKITKKSKITKRGRSRMAKKLLVNKDKRITRSEAGGSRPPIPSIPKKPSRELLKLQEDIRDMFISEDILNATGIRMCRLAKLVDDKHFKGDVQTTEAEPKPIVVLENIKSKMTPDQTLSSSEKLNKKKVLKSKSNAQNEVSIDLESKGKPKYKPGPKSKTKGQDDPYFFETESIGESLNTVDSRGQNTDSESDSASAKSFESSELLVELKKKTKRKRRSWQLGVIKKKVVKNKAKSTEFSSQTVEEGEAHETVDKNLHNIPDFSCFTDKSYCFHKNVKSYLCRLCGYRGNDIVPHYKKHHPHSEVPLSRLSPEIAKEAIEQCENMNLQAISKIHTLKYVCRFCFQEFHKQNTALETFFWHVVSVHTGEYKHLCFECINITRCPFHLDIPPPPKNLKGQLIGYICGRCNFTQVSLENLKTHVIVRHDDEQTEVYSINLGEIPRKILQSFVIKSSESSTEGVRVLRSTRSNRSVTEPSDDHSDITESTDRVVNLNVGRDNLDQEIDFPVSPKIAPKSKIQSKFIFENDDISDASTSYSKNDEIIKASIKLERDDDTQDSYHNDTVKETVKVVLEPEPKLQQPLIGSADNIEEMQTHKTPSTDVLNYPHFKIKLNATGTKEYVCCINGTDNHYKTTLLISFKKHVQLKHSENWDGYCFLCKVIVTEQGKHKFKDCLQHFLYKHMDDFPIYEEISQPLVKDVSEPIIATHIQDSSVPKSFINVRPLAELISSEQSETETITTSMPKIQSVVSLGPSDEPVNSESQANDRVYNYEKPQMEVMTKKHRVVLEAMLSPEKLIQVFKCAGHFCSYTTDDAKDALLHASTHQRIGGEGSLKCTYCDFDSSGNAIDLVIHVFKNYNHCSYACSKCFYRAAVSQLVFAHIKRAHAECDPEKVPVLSSATMVKDNTKDDLISRDEAVLYYICNNRDPDDGGVCQFKSYVLTKFREHLQTRHANDQEYSCYMCNISMPSSKLLAQHLKSHGLRIYQCCRCLFGADNELELMSHASEKHPLKQPKAYLRIITSKGGSSEVRVLPLAVLSKSPVATTVVTPRTNKESPVKQAERSIDLEKLIGQTNLMIESMNTITDSATVEPIDVIVKKSQIENDAAPRSTSQTEAVSSSSEVSSLLKESQDKSSKLNVVVKVEPVDIEMQTSEMPPVIAAVASPDSDVVCLDSDDDSPHKNIIDLSGEDVAMELNDPMTQVDTTNIKIPRIRLYACPKCSIVSRNEAIFKRHITLCFPNPAEVIKCTYCSYTTIGNRLVMHYNNNHLQNSAQYMCAKCNGKYISLSVVNKHMKAKHNVSSTTVTSKVSSIGEFYYLVDSHLNERQTHKRKFSGDPGSRNSEPTTKLKKYGPQDVDKLPINPILDDLVYCSLCEFNTKVRLNMVRHLQLHAEQQPVPKTAPVNPVPHLESNEKHFDKMVNLASSSISTNNRMSKDGTAIVIEHLSPEAAAKYPKYVPVKHRYTCGAKDCSYISVNESMFKIHWETLHAIANDYHCVHCPPNQQLDTTKPLTVTRIIAHLKMHDIKLYACSSCVFYHHVRKVIEKHLKEVHSGKLLIVREDGMTAPVALPMPVQTSTAPTMDLKPWQCGLCKFKSMIRPEVIEHCGKFHQSKMQYKCAYCGFRTSNFENISKHQSKQHPGKKEDVFYFYYREGSIPEEADGIARWQKQSQKSESQIKTEADSPPPPDLVPMLPNPTSSKPSDVVNLDIVKKEVVEPENNAEIEETVEDLCNSFGQFGDPNGLKYKCTLCKVIIEDTKEAMQSHLYEELQYRKWGCAICSYKAFHKPGLQQHVQTEHGHNRDAREPIELKEDSRIEAWVAKFLEHQTSIIEKNKENLAKQKAEILRANPGSSAKVPEKPAEPSITAEVITNVSMVELEQLFGPLGVPSNMNFTCPKCKISARTEAVMQEHLESELNKIRWCCNLCSETFQTYHEAQFHCRSVHPGQSSRPVEATRDASLRAAWVSAVLRVQKLSMNIMPLTAASAPEATAQPTDNSSENSLLVVRYEEKVPTPEEQMKLNKKNDTDDNKVITEESENKKSAEFECQFCGAAYKNESFFQSHVLKHYGLKPYTCGYCSFTDHKKTMEFHIKNHHPKRPIVYVSTSVPVELPVHDLLKTATSTPRAAFSDVEAKIICLCCEEAMSRAASQTHYHDNIRPQFGMKGTAVYRCWTCLTLHKTSNDFNLHHKQFHPNEKKNSSFYKLHEEKRSLFCSPCNQMFKNMSKYRSHQQIRHGLKSFVSLEPEVIELDDEADVGGKRKAEDNTILPVSKRVAKKSTTKLPSVMGVAKKSTTKLPFDAPCDDEEYSYYGTRPSMDNLEKVTTLMPFCNTFVPFTLKKLSEIINIYPVVVVKDMNDNK